MYTQCPDCGTAFRVTAEVLRQAAGQVRCGGCKNAFNALDFLSETVPEQPPVDDVSLPLPELTPELIPDRDENDTGLPKSISAEQSAALLKTLDQLAGSDIRIEDTGVEWRVLDEDEITEFPPNADDAAPFDNISNPLVDAHPFDEEVFSQPENSVIDELLDATPTPVDEILAKAPEVVEAEEIFGASANEAGKTPVDEIRFDDNTPLPDDFDLDDESSYAPPEPQAAVDDEPVQEQKLEPQPDITLSDPEEWDDLLGEFAELGGNADDTESTDEELIEAAAPEAEPLDIDTQFSLQAEAMGIDLSGEHDLNEMPIEIEFGDLGLGGEKTGDDVPGVEEPDVDELGYDASDELELDEFAAALDAADDDTDLETNDVGLEIDVDDAHFKLVEEPIIEHHDIEDELAALEAAQFDGDDNEAPLLGDTSDVAMEDRSVVDHDVTPLTQEEQSVNMMIDRDLMALAIEDKDGFASTIVVPDDAFVPDTVTAGRHEEHDTDTPASWTAQDEAGSTSGFEAIVMEGESIQTASDHDKRETDRAAAVASLVIASAPDEVDTASSNRRRFGFIGGIAALILLLLVQMIHQSREALATIPVFNNAIGSIYRALGQPLQPEWDIRGWRFEATKGSTDIPADDNSESESEQISIFSRIGNKSDKALPYPLIGISLTDRFEETIGSRILDPAEYLPSDVDPRKLVKPGENFNAVITIQTPSKDTTGFKLNVCYRMSEGNLRCAIEDFK